MSTKLIILDRDGVINYDSDQYIKSPEEWKPIPGSLEAIARLTQWNWRVVIATNQSGLAQGLFDMLTLTEIHEKMIQAVANAGGRIDAIFYCPHTNANNCNCRKPKPGMLLEIASRFGMELKNVPAVGDSLRDLQAAISANAKPILVRTGKGEKTSKLPDFPAETIVYQNLATAVNGLLKT